MAPSVDLEQKCLEILKAAVPGATRAARLGYTGAWKPGLYGEQYARGIFERTGLALTSVDVGGRPDEIDSALETIAASRSEVLQVYGHEILFSHFPRIAEFAARRGIASISESVFYVPSGGLLFYGTNPLPQMKRLAALVTRILRGARPAELPVEQPTEFELVLNKKVADAMRVRLPQSFLVRVDRVVE
jgi:putative ABC transport system substrate-binding protein